MDEAYLLVVDGKPAGPYTIEQLKAIGIKAGDFVKTAAMVDYKEAHEVAELRSIFGFKLQSVTPQYFGAFDQRVLAAVIDWLLVGGIFVIAAYIIVIAITRPNNPRRSNRQFICIGAISKPGLSHCDGVIGQTGNLR